MVRATPRKLRADSSRTVLRRAGMDALAVLIGLLFLFPLYWILISSFKTDVEIFNKNIAFWPRDFSVEPWIHQLTDNDFLYSLRNSFVIASLNMILSTILGCTAAYGLAASARRQEADHAALLVTQMMPGSLLLTPLYLMFTGVGMLNSFEAPVLAIARGRSPSSWSRCAPSSWVCPNRWTRRPASTAATRSCRSCASCCPSPGSGWSPAWCSASCTAGTTSSTP
jgi:multiple sugar transport system permease protein